MTDPSDPVVLRLVPRGDDDELPAGADGPPRSAGRCCWCGEHQLVDPAGWCSTCGEARDADARS